MIKEETWSVSLPRAKAFFREQQDVTEESAGVYLRGTCRITLTELKPSIAHSLIRLLRMVLTV